MKVVINRCFGGFGLSERAIEECIKRGMTVTRWVNRYNPVRKREDAHYEDESADFVDNRTLPEKRSEWDLDKTSYLRLCGSYSIVGSRDDLGFRTNPVVVAVVEELGKEADGSHAELRVVEIPFETTEGWVIDEYDGQESIEETHRSWS